MADFHIPRTSPVRRQLESYVDEFPLAEFALETLDRELYDLDRYVKDPARGPLTEIDEYRDAEAVAERLLADFQTLPWDYRLTAKLPDDVAAAFDPELNLFEISDDLCLWRGGVELERETPLEDLSEAAARRVRGRGLLGLMLGGGPKWDPEGLYLQAKVSGFIGPYGDSQPHRAATNRIKGFLGLLLATRAVQLKPRSFGASSKEEIYVHRQLENRFSGDNRLQLDEASSAVILRMTPFNNSGKMNDEAAKRTWFRSQLADVARAFSQDDVCSNLVLAGRWLFDSQADPDPLVTYIRSMVVLEILLGSQKDTQELSIGELIANRCAYLVGQDFRQRSEIMKDFKRIYAVRSQIVHRGKAQLTLEERGLLNKLQWMGRRVIQEEITKIPAPKQDE